MKKQPSSRSAFFNPRVLMSCAFCATGVVVALALAFAAPNVAAPKKSAAVTASASATDAVWITPVEQESPITPAVEETSKAGVDVLTGCSWSAAAAYPITTSNAGAVTIGSSIYVFGGDSSTTGSAPTTAANKFDGTTWTAIAALPAARAGAAVATDGTFAYILGGVTTGGVIQTTLTRYDPVGNSYTTMAAPPTGTYSSAAVVLSGKLYRIGGNTGGVATGLATVDVYTIRN